jgi:hypothetical protein
VQLAEPLAKRDNLTFDKIVVFPSRNLMSLITHKCPHCRTEHIAFGIAAIDTWADGRHCAIYLRCPKCKLPSCGIISTPNPQQAIPSAALQQQSGDILQMGWEIDHFWPEPPGPLIPELLPPDVQRVYLQAERNFPIEGNEEASGTMYRKALDIALKKIDPSLSGMLGPRIKKLAEAGKLTTDIAAWADTVRDVGNDAAHEEEPITREELTQLRSFSEMLLRYLFSLPGAVKKRRGQKLDWETESS